MFDRCYQAYGTLADVGLSEMKIIVNEKGTLNPALFRDGTLACLPVLPLSFLVALLLTFIVLRFWVESRLVSIVMMTVLPVLPFAVGWGLSLLMQAGR